MKGIIARLILVSVIFSLAGCGDRGALDELAALKEKAATEQQNMDLVRHCLEEINNRNLLIIDEVIADDYRFHGPSNNPVPMLKKDMPGFIEQGLAAFPDLRYNIESMMASGNQVAVRMVTTGTHLGDFMEIPATGNKIEISSTIIYLLEDGKIVEEREDADWLGLRNQLGMDPKQKEGGD